MLVVKDLDLNWPFLLKNVDFVSFLFWQVLLNNIHIINLPNCLDFPFIFRHLWLYSFLCTSFLVNLSLVNHSWLPSFKLPCSFLDVCVLAQVLLNYLYLLWILQQSPTGKVFSYFIPNASKWHLSSGHSFFSENHFCVSVGSLLEEL